MIITIRETPPEGIFLGRFGPDAFATQVGTEIRFSAGSWSGKATLTAATVADDGSYADLSLDVPDDMLPDIQRSIRPLLDAAQAFGGPILTEQITDRTGTYTAEWYVDPPAPGTTYRVVDCTWTPDRKTRRIYKIELGQGKSQR